MGATPLWEPACTDTVHKLPPHLGTVPLHYEEPACTDTVHEPPPHLGTGPPNQDEPAMLVQVQITTVSLQYEEPALEDLKIYISASGLSWFICGVSECTQWQVRHQHCSRTGSVHKNHNILRKNTILYEHPV